MTAPDSEIRKAVAAALRQSIQAQLTRSTTPEEKKAILARLRAELALLLEEAPSGSNPMSDLHIRAMLAAQLHEVAEELAAEAGASPAPETPSIRVTVESSQAMQPLMAAAHLAELCARAKLMLTEARAQERRLKVAYKSAAGLQRAHRLERIGLALLTVGELADAAAESEPAREVPVRTEQLEVLRAVLWPTKAANR